MRLLVVEDDAPLADGLASSLRQSGYAVDWIADGNAAQTALITQDYDLVILDLSLPGKDGFALLSHLRSQNKRLPVLILSARDASAERVRGLDLGADDYLTKPFDLGELEARVRALIRRSQGMTTDTVQLGGLRVDTKARRALLNGTPIDLTGREYALLELLALRAGHVVSKQQIADNLCEWGDEMSPGAIEIHVHRVRKKLESSGVTVRTLRGFGYLLEGTPEADA